MNNSNIVAIEDQFLTIPQGWFVCGCDLDAIPPTYKICKEKNILEEQILLFPPALAYYLSTHFCGSYKMKTIYENGATLKLQNEIKEVLGICT
jgi:hypothetical protein